MENQHKKIKGYRDLSETEIKLMNKVKEQGVELGQLIEDIQSYLACERAAKECAAHATQISILEGRPARIEFKRFEDSEAQRWAAIAKTDLQQGLMALTRAIAQPGFF